MVLNIIKNFQTFLINIHITIICQVFLDFIVSRALARDKDILKRREPSRSREKLSPKLYSTSCQNNSFIGNFMEHLCTCSIAMGISI